ncbi:amidase [Nevskia ramosa]|uniref:amidase n=1 Tax=Nevskia ramosa TaxID=64002 RepID=UPI003D0BA9D6
MKKPTHDEMAEVARDLGMHMSAAEIDTFLGLMDGTVAAYSALEDLPDELPIVKYPRTPGYQPPPDENPYNAWYVKSRIEGAPTGPLKGKTFAIKDNICVAGVPMMNGSSTLQGYLPDVDATLVTRILDAGGTVLGKSHCEHFCFSGGSHTGSIGPVINPHKPGYSSGGSSSGSAALVAAGDVDMAIGSDQGGSIRMPSSWCGTVGMKATHGLVPYSGIMAIEATLDHIGPITATVADNALLLDVIAGSDGLDPRQIEVKRGDYMSALNQSLKGMRIGVVREGFGHANSEADVDAAVRKAAAQFGALGATVEEVSIPMHSVGMIIWSSIAHEGATTQMMHGNGFGFNWKGLYVTSLQRAHDAWRQRADELSDTVKLTILFGHHVLKKYRGHHYAKAQNLNRRLRAAYDEALSSYDLLLMPTTPMKATKIPPADCGPEESCARGLEMIANTAPFDASGHPAISIPCGTSKGLPIGLMLIGRHWDEATIYRAAHAYEQSVGGGATAGRKQTGRRRR